MNSSKNNDFLKNVDIATIKQLLLKTVAQSFNSVVITDATPPPNGPLIVYVNQAFCKQTGYTPGELIGQSPKILQGPLTERTVLDELRQCLKENRYFQGNTINYQKNGKAYEVEWNISPITNDEGKVTHYASIQRDISDRQARQESEKILATALNAADEAIYLTDAKGHFLFVNKAFEKLSGYAFHQILGKTPEILSTNEENSHSYSEVYDISINAQPFHGNFENTHKNGDKYYCQQSISPILSDDGVVTHFVTLAKDVTKAVLEEKQKNKALISDPLTEVLNRRGGEQELQKSLLKLKDEKITFCVILLDIDYFKQVNDRYGHDIGDEVIKLVAKCLMNCARDYDSVVRWGGEEFLIIANNCELKQVVNLSSRIRSKLREVSFPHSMSISVSQGLAQAKFNQPSRELIKTADQHLYSAKQSGRDCFRF